LRTDGAVLEKAYAAYQDLLENHTYPTSMGER